MDTTENTSKKLTCYDKTGKVLDFWWTSWYPFALNKESVIGSVSDLISKHLAIGIGTDDIGEIAFIKCMVDDSNDPIILQMDGNFFKKLPHND